MFLSLGIENLPFELQRNFQLMRDLDQRTEGKARPELLTRIKHSGHFFIIYRNIVCIISVYMGFFFF